MFSLLFKNEPNVYRLAIFELLFLAMLTVFWFLIRSDVFAQHSNLLTAGILFDLLISAPILYWFFWRRTQVSPVSFAAVALVGLGFAAIMLEATNAFAVPVRVLFFGLAFACLVFFFRFAIVAFRKHYYGDSGYDRKARIESAIRSILGSHALAEMIATEMTTWAYLLASNKGEALARIDAPASAQSFSYHQKNGVTALLLAFCMVVMVEIVGVHVVLSFWSEVAAWLATASSIYLVVFVVAHIRSMKARPVFLSDGVLHIRTGLFLAAEIPLSQIERVQISGTQPNAAEAPMSFSMPASHNVVLHLKEPHDATTVYGIKRPFQIGLMYLDEPEAFRDALIV